MTIKVIILMVAVTLTPSSTQVLSQSAISSVLQDILSPCNSEKAMQLVKMAALRSNNKLAIPEMARAVTCGDVLPGRIVASNDYIPRAVIASNDYLPARAVASKMPVRVLANDGYARVLAGPELSAQKILRQVPVNEVKNVQPNLLDSLVMPKEIFQPFPLALPREAAPRPCLDLPPASNPYLPVASPVSAISPANLPPPTQSRGQFLRKIPIPPPTL